MKYKIAVIGATGFTGMELIRILKAHPYAELNMLTSESYAGLSVKQALPYFNTDKLLEKADLKKAGETCDVIFLCLPHTKSAAAAAKLLKFGKKLIDLSADFRLKAPKLYAKYYGVKHPFPGLLKESVYGLPELNAHKIRGAAFTANPGCYPTGAILACAPAVCAGLVKTAGIVINSVSGVSGAGRKMKTEYHFSEQHANIKAYKLVDHQHTPEIEQELSKLRKNAKATVSFTPHLGPYNRGIITTVAFDLLKNISTEKALAVYKVFYAAKQFVKVLPEGVLPEVKNVAGSNFCEIGLKVNTRLKKLIVVSAIDNLVKGASGQAVQNMNLMLGLPESAGLLDLGMMP